MKSNKKRIIPLLLAFTMLLPIMAQALEFLTIQLKIRDEESGINEILLPDGSKTTDTDIEYAVDKNGFYKFIAYDKAGNIAQEYLIEVSNINENTEMKGIENIINEAEEEYKILQDGSEKTKLKEQLQTVKENYDDEVKSRIDKIDINIDNMISIDEKEITEDEIENLPEKYQSNKYTPSVAKEKERLIQKLQDKINGISNKSELEIATQAVEKAEKTLNQEDINNAREKVNSLNDDNQKIELNRRLDLVQELKDKIRDIEKEIENMSNLDNKNHIQEEINKLPEGTEKDRLQQKLNDKIEQLEAMSSGDKSLQEAIETVKKAESTLQQIDLDSAWVQVKQLPQTSNRDELSDRLNIVQELIFAIEQIEKDIDNMNSLDDVSWIQRDIDRLPSGSERDRLQKSLDSKARLLGRVEDENNALWIATQAVEKSEQTISRRDIDKAWILVNRLPNSRDKDELIRRLDRLQDIIDDREIEEDDLDKAIKAVERVEVTLQQKDLDEAKVKVDKLPSSIIKDSLNKRLDLIQILINKEREDKTNKEKGEEEKLQELMDAVKKAEVTMKDEDIENAKDKINLLPEGPRKDILKERIELIEKIKTLKELKEEADKAKAEQANLEKEKTNNEQVQKPEPEKPKAEVEKPKPAPAKPTKPETSKPTKPANNNNAPTTNTTKPAPAKPVTSTGGNGNITSESNQGHSDNSTDDEQSVDENPYYKKPTRDKQTQFFKLKEPEIAERIEKIEEVSSQKDFEDTESVVEVVIEEPQAEKPKKSKLPLIIILLVITGIGVGVFFFIKNKKESNEENYEDNYDDDDQ